MLGSLRKGIRKTLSEKKSKKRGNDPSKSRRHRRAAEVASFSDEYDSFDQIRSYVPRDIEVAKWVLDVPAGHHRSPGSLPVSPNYGPIYERPLSPSRSAVTRRRVTPMHHKSHPYPYPVNPRLHLGDYGPLSAGPLRPKTLRSSSSRSRPVKYPKSQGATKKTVKSSLSRPKSSQRLSHSPMKVKVRRRQGGERVGWEFHNVALTRVHGYGFGIAVSGGRDNPHFMNGDPSIAISDVLKAGPAEGKLSVNDRVITANGISLESVDYNTAVQVLRECGNTVNLLIKRRIFLPSTSDLLKVSLTKSKKKDDFGIVLGCRIFIKEVTNRSLIEKEGSLQEGDLVIKINNTSTENLSLKEAKKLIDSNKEKLNLVIKREQNALNNRLNEVGNQSRWSTANLYDTGNPNVAKESGYPEGVNGTRPNWSNQNVYVQPPTRGNFGHLPSPPDDKNNLVRMQQQQQQQQQQITPRSRGPISDISLTQLDQPATPLLTTHSRNPSQGVDDEPPPRPPPPRPNNYGDDDPLTRRKHIGPVPEPRVISFQKDGSVGIRLTGGNEVGIFVTAVQPGSPASLQGLQPGDKIVKVNKMDMRGVTREEGVLYLLSIHDQIDLIVQYRKDEYDEIVATQKGDSFYIRTHFSYTVAGKGELGFHCNEVFRVIDTLFNGVVGSWLVYRLGRNNQEIQKGVIPNKSRADELAAEQNAERAKKGEGNENRGSFFKRRSARRSKSLGKDHWEDVVFSDSLSKFPAYERVTLKHPGFIRPVIIFGPLADIARDKLLKDYPDKYGCPQLENPLDELPKSHKSLGIVRLSAIKEIVEKGKHALLDITPNAVDRLNYAQFYPVVIFMRAENKSIVKELRSRYAKSGQKSSRKLFDNAVKLEKLWSHVFTSTIALTSADMWYKKLRETIEKQQQQSIWAAEAKPEEMISDEFLFPMTSRLSYASSPESDLDLTIDSKGGHDDSGSPTPRLTKASSDPSIATAEDAPGGATGYPGLAYNHRSHRQELDKALNQDLKASTHSNENNDSVDREEYFGATKETNYALYPSDRYPNPGVSNGSDQLDSLYGVRPSGHNGPEPPPRIDRLNKPTRFRSAHERLFGRPDPRDRDSVNAPDYINTTIAQMPPPAPAPAPSVGNIQKSASLERSVLMPNGRSNFVDNSSYSSDSYNQYGSPTSTLDERKYGSLTSGNSGTLPANARPAHDPYRFTSHTRSTAQVLGLKQGSADRNSKAGPSMTPNAKYPPEMNGNSNSRPNPPSPPPKPSSYQPVRLNDGRPVPPPKPVHYQSGRPNQWRQEAMGGEGNVDVYGQSPLSPAAGLLGLSQSTYGSPKRASASNMDMSGGPPAYFPPTKDQPPMTRAPGPPPAPDTYANHTSFGSPVRRVLYSDTDSSSGYLTGKNSYDMRSVSQYSSKTASSRTSSLMNGNGPYLNLPYPPRHRDSTSGSGPPNFPPSPSQPLQPPPNLADLSANRENRGSAFELYRKPGESMSRPFHYHGLPPPPPPPIPAHENKRLSTVSTDSTHKVVAVAKGNFGHAGGTLTSEETGVSIVIPEGALPDGVDQEIYFKVCEDMSILPPLDQEKGETLLSPIVMCGPRGLTFDQPVELRLPHCASTNPESWSFALKSSDTTNGQSAEWQNVTPGDGDGITASTIDTNFVSVLVDHF